MEAGNGKVTVRFLASLKDVFRRTELTVDAGRVRTVGELLRVICATPEQTQNLYTLQGSVRSDLTVLVNGRHIAFSQQLETALREGDLVTMFLPTAGG